MNGTVGYILIKDNLIKTAAKTKVKEVTNAAVRAAQVASGAAGAVSTGILAYTALNNLKRQKELQKNQEELAKMQLELMDQQARENRYQDIVLSGQNVPLNQNYAPQGEFKVAAASTTQPVDEFDAYLKSLLGDIEQSFAQPVESIKQDNSNKSEISSKKQEKNIQKKAMYSEEERERIITDILEKKANFEGYEVKDIIKEVEDLKAKNDEELEKESEYWNSKILNEELNVAEPYRKVATSENGQRTSEDIYVELVNKLLEYRTIN